MIKDAIDSFADIFSTPFRGVMWKSLGLTFAILLVAGLGLDQLALHYLAIATGWLHALIAVMVGLGLVAGLALLAAPTTSLVASFYLDEIAALVEREVDPSGPAGRPAPFGEAIVSSLRFVALSLVVTLAALILLFIPGLGFVAWVAANAYLLGGEYFELAAMRFRSANDARELRRRAAGPVYLAGLIIAGFVSIPFLNLFTPLFATALMARLHKRLSAA